MNTTKKYFLLTAASVLIVVVCIVFYKTNNSSEFKLEVCKIENGWGYYIIKGNKIFIKQDCIPAVEQNKAFPNRATAEKAGKLMIKKLNSHKMPSITKEEISNILINID